LADEHHETRDGEKCYLAITVDAGCFLRAASTASAAGSALPKLRDGQCFTFATFSQILV